MGREGQKSLRRRLKHLRRSLYPFGVKLAIFLASGIPQGSERKWASVMGDLAYLFLPKQRKLALTHLKMAMGELLDEESRRRIARECFRNLLMTGVECFRLRKMGPDPILRTVEIRGWEHVEDAHRRGKGGIFVTAHLGNWELSAIYVAWRGLPMNVVARRIYLGELDRELVSFRARMGVRTIYRDQSMRVMLRCLQRNEFLGILPDQDVRRVGGIFVEFFGRQAYTPVGPALLAMASGAPLLLARNIRKDKGHLITVDPPLFASPEADREEEVRRLVALYTKRLEEFIRESPEQWVWMHRRWRTSPDDLAR